MFDPIWSPSRIQRAGQFFATLGRWVWVRCPGRPGGAGGRGDDENPLAPKQPHFPPKAKRVILLWMQGGPSQMDLFDYKPRLEGGSRESNSVCR